MLCQHPTPILTLPLPMPARPARKRRHNLNVGINPTSYVHNSWKYRLSSRSDIADLDYYLRLARIAHNGVFDAVFVSDMPLMRLAPTGHPTQIIDPLSF